MDNPAQEAAAAARRAKKQNEVIPNTVRGGQPIGECPDCGTRFDYGSHAGDAPSNMDPCPNCGSRDWYKWGYRHHGEEIRRDKAWDRYDAPPSVDRDDGFRTDGGDPSTDKDRCELCGREVEGGLKLTHDGHPHGPNLMVGDCCIDLDERLPEYEADVIEQGWERDV